jgi:hypothetical protein
MAADPCPCGHDEHSRPTSVREALALVSHLNSISSLLEVEASDPARWLRVYRCRRCGQRWAEDSISSGHADLFYAYPIDASDPHAWLARASPLQPRLTRD